MDLKPGLETYHNKHVDPEQATQFISSPAKVSASLQVKQLHTTDHMLINGNKPTVEMGCELDWKLKSLRTAHRLHLTAPGIKPSNLFMSEDADLQIAAARSLLKCRNTGGGK